MRFWLFVFLLIFTGMEFAWSANTVNTFKKRNGFESLNDDFEAQEIAQEISRQQELISEAEKERRKVLGKVYEIRQRLKKVEKEKSP